MPVARFDRGKTVRKPIVIESTWEGFKRKADSPSCSIEGDVKRNISPASWKPAQRCYGIQPPVPRFVAAGGCGEIQRNSVRREAAIVHPIPVHMKGSWPTNGRPWTAAGFQFLPFPLERMRLLPNGPERSRARRQARRSEPWTARTVRREWARGKGRSRRWSIPETKQAERMQCVNHDSI
jgi:hypothetical protein